MKPLDKTTRTEMVVEKLKECITSGTFSVGDKFYTENEISNMLNVGRSTVREANRILQAIGYLEMKPGRGVFVAKTREENPDNSIVEWFKTHGLKVIDFMDVRMAIEPLAVKLAIERASDEDIKKLEAIHEQLKLAIDKGDSKELALIDCSFHNIIVESTYNELLINVNRKISDAFTKYREMAFSVRENIINALIPHENILNAIKSKNEKKRRKRC